MAARQPAAAAAAAAPPETFKIGVQGLSNVGKTSLCVRFESNTFTVDGCEPTLFIDILSCRLCVAAPDTAERGAEQRDVRLQVYDTAGQERFESGLRSFMRNLAGCLVVFSLTSRASYRRARAYADEVREHSPDAVIVLVGNKLDLVEACSDTRVDDVARPRLADTLDFARTLAANTEYDGSASPRRSSRNGGGGERVELFPRAPRTYGELAAVPETRFGFGRDARPASGARVTLSAVSANAVGGGGDGDGGGDGYGSDSDASAIDLDAESGAVAGTAPASRRNVQPPTAAASTATTGPDPAQRSVPRAEAAAYARVRNFSYVETSALRGTHVVGAFRLLAERIVAAAPLRGGASASTASTASLVDLGPSPSPSQLASFYEGDADAQLDAVDAALDAGEPRRRGCEC